MRTSQRAEQVERHDQLSGERDRNAEIWAKNKVTHSGGQVTSSWLARGDTPHPDKIPVFCDSRLNVEKISKPRDATLVRGVQFRLKEPVHSVYGARVPWQIPRHGRLVGR